MGLTMLVGRSGTNKNKVILEEIKNELLNNPNGKPIYYIVPEQMTFQEEYALLQNNEMKGSIRAQVVNFSRLAFRVLQETGGSTRKFISSTGIQMMLRKIIQERPRQFLMFQKASDKRGFIEELEGMITEFKRHQITPEILDELLHTLDMNETLHRKLLDIHYIYEKLQSHLKSQYIDGEDQLQLLQEKIPNTPSLQNAHIYINGFFRFTPKELEIIRQLLKVSKKVTIALTLEETNLQNDLDELDLFYQTTETYKNVYQIAQEENITIHGPKKLFTNESTLKVNDFFAHLEKNFDKRPISPYLSTDRCPIYLREAVHPRVEVEAMIQEIIRLTRDENYRYQDIVILHRDAATYNELIQTLFDDYRIPYFIDEKKTMLNHSFIEFVRSLLDCLDTNWKYDALFRFLKTGYMNTDNERYPLTMDGIDQLENYCLEYGIRNKKQWIEGKWEYRRYYGMDEMKQSDDDIEFENKINAYREQIVSILLPFDEAMKRAKTIKEKATALFQYLMELDIASQLESERDYYDEQGKVEKAREQEQVWDSFVQLLDELVELVGNEPITFSEYKEMIETGMEALEFAHVPPTIDHVIIGSIDQSRIEQKKCAFLLGVNEGTWPMKPDVDGMISEQEREWLKQFGMPLAESSRRVLLDEQFYMYLACTKATEHLYMSYVIADSEGKGKSPSPLIKKMHDMFPNIQTELLLEPEELYDANRYITTPAMTISPLVIQLSKYLRGYPIESIWWDVLKWYLEHNQPHTVPYNVLQSLFYENKPVNLKEDTIDQLYDENVNTSVSRLEMLHRCSYQHFVQYGLQLKERRTYSLEAPDIGQLFHEALKTITEWVTKEGKDLSELTRDEVEKYADESITFLAPLLQNQILTSSNRYKYMTKKLRDVIAQATFVLSEQAKVSGFKPIGVEVAFGENESLKPLRIPLPNGYTLQLRGRIDRVDQVSIQDDLYLRIIDYKSSNRDLDLLDVYYGLSLQMLTYLHVVLNQAEQWLGKAARPGGVLYFHVHDAMVQSNQKLPEEVLEDEWYKKYKMKGFITNDEMVAREMDYEVSTGWSKVVPVGFKKDGFYSQSSILNEEVFTVLENHIMHLIRQAGFHITSGNIALNPYEYKNERACTYCEFKSICQFDPILKENNYHTLLPMKDDDIIRRIQVEEEGENGEVDK